MKPDTIHPDTQGQSNAIFGLAYLLGIQLIPRIRNWKGKTFYRPSPETRFEHIDSLFTAQVDWDQIEIMVKAQGQQISDDVLAAVSPYQTSHINRFGQHQLHSRRDRNHWRSFASRHKPRRVPEYRPSGIGPNCSQW